MITTKGRYIFGQLTEEGLLVNAIGDFTPKGVTSCSLNSGYYTEVKYVTLTANYEVHYSINNGPILLYTAPILLESDAVLVFWALGEDPQERTYIIDLNPLKVSFYPKPGTYRETKVKFNLNKPGRVFWSFRGMYVGNPYSTSPQYVADWTDWTELVSQEFLLIGNIDILYYCISEGRTYPIKAVSYYFNPEAHAVNIYPSPVLVSNEDKILVTMENNYE